MNPLLAHRAAADLTSLAGRLGDEALTSREEATELAAAGSGEAWQALHAQLARLPGPLDDARDQILAVAEVMRTSAQLAELLDGAVARVEPFVDAVPGARNTLAFLRGLGTALDLACAAQILEICQPASPLPTPRIADYPDHPLSALHDVHAPFADEHVRKLLDANPDLVILELPDGGLVAAVAADPDASEQVDLDDVATVTTYVPGVGSADPDSWQAHIDRTRLIADAAGGPRSAGVVWIGYRAPDNIVQGLGRRTGRSAGADLAAFQSGLARRNPGQRRVVLGFSYGSVVASEAARAELHADDVVLLGSPGVEARHVDDYVLHGRDPAVRAMTSPGDPIGLLTGPGGGVHGVDPTSPLFGAEVHDPGVRGDHGSYFRDDRFYDALREAVGSGARG